MHKEFTLNKGKKNQMIDIKGFRIYLWTAAWGWHLTGVGYKAKWFLGLSVASFEKEK